MTVEAGVTVFDTATGAIVSDGPVPAGGMESVLLNPGEDWVSGRYDGGLYWINPETRRANLRRDPAVTITGNTVSGIPDHCWVTVNGHRIDPADGAVSIAVDLPEDAEVMIGGPRVTLTRIAAPCDPAAAVDDAAPGAMRLPQDYAALRRQAYDAAGITIEELAVAMIEADPAELARIRAARTAIKARFPKKADS